MSDGIIVEKKIVFKAIDEVTSPLTKMNQKMTDLESKLNALGLKFNSGASEQTSFKSALNSTKASLSETAEASKKLDNSIRNIKGKDIKVKADTKEGQEKLTQFEKVKDQLARKSPVIKPKVDPGPAEKGFNQIKESSKRAFGSIRSFVAGNLIANGVSSISSHLWDWAKAGYEAAKAGSEVAERWKNLGMTDNEVKATGAAVKDLKENSNLSGAAVGDLVTRFYGFTGSASRARELATGVASLSDKMKLSQSQADGFANGLTRIESAGKVSSQSLGRLERSAPGLTKALQQASGMSKKAFSDLLSSGKMTSDQFNNLLAKASKDWKKNSEDWAKTPDGALHHIKTQFEDTRKALMMPLVKTSGTGLNALSKALDKLQPDFTILGQKIADVTTKFAKWLTPQHAKDLGEIVASLGRMVAVLGKGAWKAATFPLQIIGRVINGLSGKKGDALDSVASALDHISKNKIAMGILEGIGAVLGAQFAYSKMFKIAQGIGLINKSFQLFGKWKLSGHILTDLGKVSRKLLDLKKIKINPANWFKGKLDVTKFIGKGNSFKGLFSGLQKEAEVTGTSSAKVFASRFGSLAKNNLGRLGGTLGGRLASGMTLVMAGFDLFKGLQQKGNARAISMGKGFGTIIGGAIGGVLGGPVGMAIGSTLGQAVGGKLGPSMRKAGHGAASILHDIFAKHDWSSAWNKMKKGFTDTWKGLSGWWDKLIGKKTSSHRSSSSKKPSSKEIKSLGGNNYSRADIANIKEMNRAVVAYTNTLKNLKQTVKHNDPTKALNSMNKGLKNFIKGMAKSVKPLEKLAKTFKSFGKSTKTMANSIKSLTGKHGLGEFDKDLEKLNKSMKNTKVGTYFEKLSKSIKKSKLADTIKKLDKWLGSMVKDFKQLDKPLKQVTKEFTSFEKAISKLSNKKTGLSKVDTDLIKLSKDMRKYDFGKAMEKQMATANKAVGKHGFVKQFNSMVESIRKDLREFSSDFKRYWSKAWSGLSSTASRALRRANSTVRSQLNSILSKGRSFESSFKSGWRSWNNTVVSTMRSAFGKLPGIASKAMSEIIGRLNKGISGINKVISDFGGDKKLNTISYAKGTLVHPGGKALLNDGLGANKTELLWQPSKGWSTLTGQNRIYDLEKGSMVMDAEHSAPVLSAYGSMIPHYAGGTLSDDEMDKIAEGFMNNPVKASRELMLKLTDWSSSNPIIPSFGKATAIGFSRGIANVLKDLLGIIKEPINGDWGPVIKSAARLMHAHINGGFVSNLKQVIQNESGGREDRMQEIHDKNSGGNEARGLLQYTVPTFNKYAMAKWHQIMKGFDQLIAFFNNTDYANSIGWTTIWGHRKMDWLHSGPQGGRRFAMGGRASGYEPFMVADNPEHDEFIINPYASTAPSVMREAMQTMDNAHPEYRNSVVQNANAEMISLMHKTIDTIKGIELQPVLPVDETRRMINNMNNQEYTRLRG